MLIINADDLGQDKNTTNRIFDCFLDNRVNSTSAMTFMIDSERAAGLARTYHISTGLHLNLDQHFSAKKVSENLRNHHIAVFNYLKAWKWNQTLYNPFLRNSFNYVFQAQWDEFCRLYGEPPKRIDGHHHMHLCLNLLFSNILPKGIRIRRSFTFAIGEKGVLNLLYRRLIDTWLKTRFICTDAFISITPIDVQKLYHIVSLSKGQSVEIMTHPGIEYEYDFLMGPEWENIVSYEL